jgi:hypothetical protein
MCWADGHCWISQRKVNVGWDKVYKEGNATFAAHPWQGGVGQNTCIGQLLNLRAWGSALLTGWSGAKHPHKDGMLLRAPQCTTELCQQ